MATMARVTVLVLVAAKRGETGGEAHAGGREHVAVGDKEASRVDVEVYIGIVILREWHR